LTRLCKLKGSLLRHVILVEVLNKVGRATMTLLACANLRVPLLFGSRPKKSTPMPDRRTEPGSI